MFRKCLSFEETFVSIYVLFRILTLLRAKSLNGAGHEKLLWSKTQISICQARELFYVSKTLKAYRLLFLFLSVQLLFGQRLLV